MKSAILLRIAPLALLIGSGMIGCSPTMHAARPAFASNAPDPARFGARAAARAQNALELHDNAGAIAAAEIAVAAEPNRADYRALLAQAYLDGGRFASAEQSFADALSLDPATPHAAFGHALALLGQSRFADARTAIASLPASVPASDRGLALSLGGDRANAIALLEAAARAPGADARTRQNLALAYAINGDWAKASATAAQDVPADALAPRLAGWAQFTQAKPGPDQVALLLGTTNAADPGLPAQLALNRAPVAPVMAEAAPAPAGPSAPVLIAAGPAPQIVPALAPAAPQLPFAASAPVSLAAAFDTKPMLLRAERAPFKHAVVPAAPPAPVRLARATATSAQGSFAVQLGAFREPGRIERAWTQSTARLGRLASFTPSSTTLTTSVAGRLTRLSIAGFASHDAAQAVCSALRSAGGACFVRQVAGDNPVHWASAETGRRAA